MSVLLYLYRTTMVMFRDIKARKNCYVIIVRKCEGHSIDRCFKLHGYPPGWKIGEISTRGSLRW
uniref:Uncharacterized protein n=1 Tax=Arundo donax TaxID=35708 RepID=A0A0A8XX00_ARUDO